MRGSSVLWSPDSQTPGGVSGGGGPSPMIRPSTPSIGPSAGGTPGLSRPAGAPGGGGGLAGGQPRPLPPLGSTSQGGTPPVGALGSGVGGGGREALIADEPPPKIQVFEQRLGAKKHEENWNRTPNANGTGAIHVKSFHCKLNDDSLVYMDQQVNEWLDAHPQYEVKFVTTSIGEWQGKMKEMQMVVQVWV